MKRRLHARYRFLVQMAFVEGSYGVFTLNGIAKGQGPEQWGTIGSSPVQMRSTQPICSLSRNLKWRGIFRNKLYYYIVYIVTR